MKIKKIVSYKIIHLLMERTTKIFAFDCIHIPLRYYFILTILSWAIISSADLLCDNSDLFHFIIHQMIVFLIAVVVWWIAFKLLSNKYKNHDDI